jgi:sugar lactone lactonase YvrE
MISDTATPGRVYAMSLEHHVRAEAVLRNVRNWKFLAFQFEEEWGEGKYCQPLIIDRCRNLTFANLYTFRVIWLPNPFPYAVKCYGCENVEFLNIHNYTQVKFTIDNVLHDVNTGLEIRPWQIARTVLSGTEVPLRPPLTAGCSTDDSACLKTPRLLAGGFDFADGAVTDGGGNFYFIDGNRKAVFRYDTAKEKIETVWDCHLKPLSLAIDSLGSLLVIVEYFPSKKATINGRPEVYEKFEGLGHNSFGWYYNVGSTVMCCSVDPYAGESSIRPIAPSSAGPDVRFGTVWYPANRWRDAHDYMTATLEPPSRYFVAPDGQTAIAVTYDLIRSCALLAAKPNRPFYAVDEYYKRVVHFDSDERCNLHNPRVFIERGEYSAAVAPNGDIYVADGQLLHYNAEGEFIEEITLPDRPSGVVIGGRNRDTLFVTARKAVYKIKT